MSQLRISRLSKVKFISLLLLFLFNVPDSNGQKPAEPRLKWKTSVGYRSFLAVAQDTVYVSSPTGCEDYVPCGPPAQTLALDVESGKQKWRVKNIGGDCAPVVAGGETVYVSSGYLYALDAKTGAEQWKFQYSHGTSPLVAPGVIYAWQVNQLIPAGFFGGDLFAINLKTRKVNWKYRVEDGRPSSPVLINKTIVFSVDYFTSHPNQSFVYALDSQTGKLKWKRETASAALASGNLIYYTTTDNFLHIADASTGREKGKIKISGDSNIPAAVEGETILLSGNEFLQAVDLESGKQKWATERVNANNISVDKAKRNVIFPDSGEYLRALDITTGEQVWKFKLDGYSSAPAVFKDGTIYIEAGGFVYALETP